MSWLESLMWSSGRSLLIATIGTCFASLIQQWLRTLSPQRANIAWCFVLLPFFVPSLMTGFCYRDTSMSLVHYPWLRELLYASLVMMQTIPVGVIVIFFSPQPVNGDSSLYTASLMRLHFRERLRLLLTSRYQYLIAVFCVIFLLSFHESDLAALIQASGWTEWMFTKHVGGLALRETVLLSLGPVFIQTPLLIPIVLWLGGNRPAVRGGNTRLKELKIGERVIILGWLVAATLLVFMIPLIQMIRGTMIGIGNLFQQPSIFSELGDAILLATTSALLTALIAVLISRKNISRGWQRVRLPLLFLLLLPGSMGSLALGLLLAGIFQTDIFQLAYDTPLPLVLGEMFLLLPKAMILIYCLGQMHTNMERYWVSLLSVSKLTAHQSSVNELKWQLTGRNWFSIIVVVWFWAYFEVMLPSILAMPGLAPIGLVLYNNLHYGRIAALGAKLALMLIIPVTSAASFLLVRRKFF